ncbi:MAG: hypothetical protein CME65_12040 [Halobacteriovoraceae bacterium]|nr:hypothetical protein [Halobacteriovoraceae bacterium]
MTRNIVIFLLVSLSINSFAVPIDWKGTLAFDSNILNDVRRTSDNCTAAAGSQCINPLEDNARFQSMILKLNPNIIVNDGVTIRGELTTGGVRGVNLGDSTSVDSNGDIYSYYAQTTSSTLNVNQLYAEVFADTAQFRIGRFARHFGLGALVNGGNQTWDRFFSGYEGVETNLKLGNFKLSPMWAKLHTGDANRTPAEADPNGSYDSYEVSVEALYDDPNRNLKVGVYYAVREIERRDRLYNAGSQNTTLIDVFFKKEWEKVSLGLEVPMLSGEVGDLYNTGDTNADFDTNGYVFEGAYRLSDNWVFNLHAGLIKGDDGSSANTFEGMYLHPNYKFSEVIYKYNYAAFMDGDRDIFNASVTNSTYAALTAVYKGVEWSWKMGLVWAKANQVAKSGDDFYDHDARQVVTAAADQSDDMGYEANVSFDYQWNPSVVFTGYVGYHFVGDFYSFTNTSEELETSDVMNTGMRFSVNF